MWANFLGVDFLATVLKLRQDKTRQCFIWSLIQFYVYRLNFIQIIENYNTKLHTSGTIIKGNFVVACLRSH